MPGPNLTPDTPEFSYDTTQLEVAPNSPEVVVVDDSNVMLQLIQAALRPLRGIRVSVFDDPFAAYGRIGDGGPPLGLLVADFQMPEMNGRELAEAFHASDPELPIICVTGNEVELHDQREFVESIKKPFHPRVMQEAVMRHLRKNRAPVKVRVRRTDGLGSDPES